MPSSTDVNRVVAYVGIPKDPRDHNGAGIVTVIGEQIAHFSDKKPAEPDEPISCGSEHDDTPWQRLVELQDALHDIREIAQLMAQAIAGCISQRVRSRWGEADVKIQQIYVRASWLTLPYLAEELRAIFPDTTITAP